MVAISRLIANYSRDADIDPGMFDALTRLFEAGVASGRGSTIGSVRLTCTPIIARRQVQATQKTRIKEGAMPPFDTIIKNGTVIDGTRVPRYRADIGIKSGLIAAIGNLKTVRRPA